MLNTLRELLLQPPELGGAFEPLPAQCLALILERGRIPAADQAHLA